MKTIQNCKTVLTCKGEVTFKMHTSPITSWFRKYYLLMMQHVTWWRLLTFSFSFFNRYIGISYIGKNNFNSIIIRFFHFHLIQIYYKWNISWTLIYLGCVNTKLSGTDLDFLFGIIVSFDLVFFLQPSHSLFVNGIFPPLLLPKQSMYCTQPQIYTFAYFTFFHWDHKSVTILCFINTLARVIASLCYIKLNVWIMILKQKSFQNLIQIMKLKEN